MLKKIETNWRLTCLIADPSETNLPGWRPTCLIGDKHYSSEPILGKHASSEIYKRLKCLVWDPSNMSVYNGSPICQVSIQSDRLVSNHACWSPIMHVGLQSCMLVSNHACWSPVMHVVSDLACCLQWGMTVFDGSPIKHVGLGWLSEQACWSLMDFWWVSNRSQIIKIFSFTPNFIKNVQLAQFQTDYTKRYGHLKFWLFSYWVGEFSPFLLNLSEFF